MNSFGSERIVRALLPALLPIRPCCSGKNTLIPNISILDMISSIIFLHLCASLIFGRHLVLINHKWILSIPNQHCFSIQLIIQLIILVLIESVRIFWSLSLRSNDVFKWCNFVIGILDYFYVVWLLISFQLLLITSRIFLLWAIFILHSILRLC